MSNTYLTGIPLSGFTAYLDTNGLGAENRLQNGSESMTHEIN